MVDEILEDSKEIEHAFEKWLLPRLKCFCEHENGKPTEKESYEKWITELKFYIRILEFRCKAFSSNKTFLNEEIEYFWSLTPFQEWLKLQSFYDNIDNSSELLKEAWVYSYVGELFYVWFNQNHSKLWWEENEEEKKV